MNVEEAQQQIQELEQVRRQTRRMRSLTMTALVVIAISGVSAIINAAYSLTLTGPKQDRFVKTLGWYMQREMVPTLQTMASRSLGRLKPAVDAEMRQVNSRAPEVTGVAVQQLNEMAENLPVQASKIMDQSVEDTMRRRDSKLRHLYPDLYDKQGTQLMNNLVLETQDQLAQSGENIFNPHLNAVQHILGNLDKIKQTEPVRAEANLDPWQTTFMFMDLVVTEFKDIDPANQTPVLLNTNNIKH